MRKAVIIVAGGSGIRMGGDRPKQYQELAGMPLIVHSLQKFLRFDPGMGVVVVLAPSHRGYWEEIAEKHALPSGIALAQGGASRFESVRNGLALVEEDLVVGIHDAVRPLVSRGTLERTYQAAIIKGSGIPVIQMDDSVRMLQGTKGSTVVDRSLLRRVQTPQVFQSTQIKEAYRRYTDPQVTDDARVYESQFGQVNLVEGNRENIKITTPADLVMAGSLIQSVE
jgi:2-C-methyl-D-erythritol 4-phosphate cytidylyltransferase